MNNFEESPRVYYEHMKLQGFRYAAPQENFCVNNNLRCKIHCWRFLEIYYLMMMIFDKIYEEEFCERFFHA